MQYHFYSKNGAKPWVIESESLADAKRTLQMSLDSEGRGRKAENFKVQEPGQTLGELQKSEPQVMAQNIQQAQQHAQEESKKEASIPESLALGGLKFIAPYSVEEMERKGSVSPLSVATDMSLGSLNMIAPEIKAVSSYLPNAVGKYVGSGATEYGGATTAKQLASLGGAQEAIDINKQIADTGDVNKTRTAVGSLLNLLPVTAATSDKLKDIAEMSIKNTYLTPKAQAANPNSPEWRRMLDENIFGGFGKYSGLNRIAEKTEPFEKVMSAERASANPVEIETARKAALVDIESMPGIASETKEDMRNRINSFFDAELREYSKVIPEVSHMEAVPTDEFISAQKSAEAKDLGSKGAYTRSLNSIMRKPDYTYMDVVNLDQPKTYAVPKNVEEWGVQKVVEEPSRIERTVPISTAWDKKSHAQQAAFKGDISTIKGEREKMLHASRGWNEAIGETSPEAREMMRLASPYYAVKKAMENRQMVGGSNPVLSLKDILVATGAGAAGGVVGAIPALGASIVGRSPMGAQMLYNAADQLPNATAPLLIIGRQQPNYFME